MEKKIVPDDQLLFSDDMMRMIDAYLKDERTQRPIKQESGPYPFDRNTAGIGVPFIISKQLYPEEMLSEATNPDTPKERKIQLLEAFTKGYKVMTDLGCPAYRILFVEYPLSKQIHIWFD